MIYKKHLKEIREENKLYQKDLANIINLSDTQYNNYENEVELMPTKHLNTICNYFNVSFDYLFSFTNIKQYENYNENINKELAARRLKEFRKENKLTQVKLGELLNASPSVIVHHENKRHILATPFLYTICSKYNISADYLLGKVDNPKYLK